MELLHVIGNLIYNKKGSNILALDVRNVCTMTDFFVLAEGTSQKHIQALAHNIREALEQKKLYTWCTEGVTDDEWIVMDYGFVVIHLLTHQMREHYHLEQVWSAGKLVDLDLKEEVVCLKKE